MGVNIHCTLKVLNRVNSYHYLSTVYGFVEVVNYTVIYFIINYHTLNNRNIIVNVFIIFINIDF